MPTGRLLPQRSQSARTARGRGCSDTRAGEPEGHARVGGGAGRQGCDVWSVTRGWSGKAHEPPLSYGWGARDHTPRVWGDWKDGSPDQHTPCAGREIPSGILRSCEGLH